MGIKTYTRKPLQSSLDRRKALAARAECPELGALLQDLQGLAAHRISIEIICAAIATRRPPDMAPATLKGHRNSVIAALGLSQHQEVREKFKTAIEQGYIAPAVLGCDSEAYLFAALDGAVKRYARFDRRP